MWFLALEAEGKPVRALDEFEPLEGELLEFFEAYSLMATGESRVSYSDFEVYFQMEEILDYEEKHEIIFWIRKIESIQTKLRHDKLSKKIKS